MNISNLLQNSVGQYWSSFSRSASTSLAPWSALILGTSATALVGLGVYRWNRSSNQGITIYDSSFEKVKDRIKSAYAYVFGGYALTAAAAIASHVSGLSLKILQSNSYLLPIGLTVTCIGSLVATLLISKEDSKAKHIAWGIFNGTMGVMLSPLGFLNQALVVQAAAISLGVGGLLTLGAFLAPDRRFLKWEGPLLTALTTISIASSISFFFPRTAFAYGMDRISLYGGLLIFSGLLMSSTQRLMEEAEKPRKFDPINASMNIYLDTMNIFVRILRILAENQKNKD